MTLQDPRCVYQLMKKHFAPYTPEMVERITGTPQDKFLTSPSGSPRPPTASAR